MSERKGTASGPSPSRPRRDRNHQSRTARAKKTNLAGDPLVIGWVDAQLKRGQTQAAMLEAANAGADGWPRPGIHISKGVLSMIVKICKHSGVPKTTPRSVKHERVREAKSRMEQLAAELQIKNEATRALAEINLKGPALQALLINADLSELNGLADKTLRPFVDSAFSNLVDLLEIVSLRVFEFEARASEEVVRARIAHLRATSGRNVYEIRNGRALADKLEQRLADGMKLDP